MMCYMASRSCWISVLLLSYFHFVESNDHVRREAMFKAATNKGKNNFFCLTGCENYNRSKRLS